MHRIPVAGPDDLSGLRRLVDHGRLAPETIVAVLGKTEGNGCVNDFSRALAVQTLGRYFRRLLGEQRAEKVVLIMSGGTEGVLSPHLTVICREASDDPERDGRAPPGARKALSVGVARTPKLGAEEIGRTAHVKTVSDAVRLALRAARIVDRADAHYIQIKCPLLSIEAMQDAVARGVAPVTDDPYKSMSFSRAASALGAAVALGDVDLDRLTDEMIGSRWDHYSRIASASAGSELSHCEVLVLGNSTFADGDLLIGHDVMGDAIDLAAVRRAAASVGWRPDDGVGDPDGVSGDRPTELVQVFAKAESDPSGSVRGRRHTMLSDSDINHTRHARAVVGGVVAAFFGDPMIYVSGGAEHQGPPGGGPVAVVVRRRFE